MTLKIFIDENCKCHVSNPDGIYTEIEAPEEFNGKCTAYIEGFRVRPDGYTYTRDDGVVFGPNGSSVVSWKDYAELDAAQREYERQLIVELQKNSVPIVELEAAYQEGVNSI